ncbi:MAG: helix-turn-helix transcriptional regulator [Mobilitalea sp.]
MNLRDRIRVLANEKGMSLPDLESTLGFGNSTIVKWDKAIPSASKLEIVADFFNVSIDYLMGRVDGRTETINSDSKSTFNDMIQIYTRGKNNLSPEEKIRLAQIILGDRTDN